MLGRIPPSELGIAYGHEHLCALATPDLVAGDPDLALDDVGAVAEDLRAFRAAGGSSLVEMTTVDYGRDVERLAALARATRVHVVAATGFNKGSLCRPFCEGRDPAHLGAVSAREIEQGVGDTGIRPGVVKFGTSFERVEPWERVAARAAAWAHRATGAPVVTHTEAGTMAEAQLDLLEEEGVEPGAVVLGHLDRNPDPDLHRRLIARGAFLSYDQLPKAKYATAGPAVELLVTLAREGLHDRVVLGGDLSRRSYLRGFGGRPGLEHLLTSFRPRLAKALEEAGLAPGSVLHDLFVATPARAFALRTTAP